MFKTLLKSRFDAFWASFSGAGNANKKPRSMALKVVLIVVFAFLAAYMVFAFAMVAFAMDIAAKETGEYYLSFTVTTMIASLLCVIGSVFTAKTQIFESKDNELLLSMPIKPRDIFLSRITMLLIVNYALESLVLVPAIAVHAVVVDFSFLEALFTLLVFAMLPFFTLSLSCLLAWLISIVSSKIRNKTVVSVLFTILFLIIYFVACGAFGGFIGGSVEEDPTLDASFVKNTYLFYWMGSAMGEGNALNFLFFAICAIAPALLTYFLLDRSFIKIITASRGIKKIKYVAKSEAASSPLSAMIKKELRHFFSSSAYILNAGIGNVMTLLVAIMIAIFSSDLALITEGEGTLSRIMPSVLSMIIIVVASMNLVSAPSISIEDKNLWIMQSAPIDPKKVLTSKLLTHIIICEPLTLVSSVIVSIACKFSAPNAIMLALASASIVAFTAYFGLFLGLHFPKFDWQNETVAVKQGFAVFGTMFGSMIWTMIFFFITVVGSVFFDFWVMGLVFVLANVLVCVLLQLYFSKKGHKRFATLKH